MPTNIKVAVYARGYPDQQTHKSVQKQLGFAEPQQ
jgi:hypothetical protein